MIDMLQAGLFTSAETLINQLIQRDPVTLQSLERLSGKVIAIECNMPNINVFLIPNADGIQIQSVFNDTPDTTLKGNAADFIQLLASKEKSTAMFGKTVQISGDSMLASRFQEILADLQIDWEALLGDIIGDLPAHQFAAYGNWKAQTLRNSAESLLTNFDEYIKEELQAVPTRPEADLFYEEVDVLQERVDRLTARIKAKTV